MVDPEGLTLVVTNPVLLDEREVDPHSLVSDVHVN